MKSNVTRFWGGGTAVLALHGYLYSHSTVKTQITSQPRFRTPGLGSKQSRRTPKPFIPNIAATSPKIALDRPKASLNLTGPGSETLKSKTLQTLSLEAL